jgi:hypothetical protein
LNVDTSRCICGEAPNPCAGIKVAPYQRDKSPFDPSLRQLGNAYGFRLMDLLPKVYWPLICSFETIMQKAPDARNKRASRTCAECARLWKQYFDIDKRFQEAAGEWLSHLSAHKLIQVSRDTFDVRSEAEYQKVGELRRDARNAIGEHWELLHPLTARVALRAKKQLLAKGDAL